ncbi:MAG: regulatory iron-sulfur-containing complex subunit RicT [Candidatus Marinimicrobia bacterium]|nr:regulatory iron-sulfur-containing complex subunit RicT [Candidatus Neomarinimicrobiota bacterium]
MQETLIKLKFKGNRREYYRNPENFPVQKGDRLIVGTDKGYDIGLVTAITTDFTPQVPLASFEIIRKANTEDLSAMERNRRDEKEAFKKAAEKIRELGLVMKLMDVEYQLDRKKLSFYYTADERVDFRELVRILAGMFRTRIEMRQIGVRDEVKRMGGIGPCGLPLCCGAFLESFEPVSTQVAKDQSLSMNPVKLSGQCGKLKCCLLYEHGFYLEELQKYPPVGEPLLKDQRKGYIQKIDIFNKTVNCHFEDDSNEVISLYEIRDYLSAAQKQGLKKLTNVLHDLMDGDVQDLEKIEDK